MPEHHWYDSTPAGDGGKPSVLASPMVWLILVAGVAFWAEVAWLAFR